MEQITICAIEGFAIGGGLALAVALDFRIMADNAHVRLPEIALGMNMSWQSIPRMLPLIGPARTKQVVTMADRRISAAEALAWGLVEEVTAPGKTFEAALAFAPVRAREPEHAFQRSFARSALRNCEAFRAAASAIATMRWKTVHIR